MTVIEYPEITPSAAGLVSSDALDSAASLLCATVAAAFALKPDDLRSVSRGRSDVAFARQVAMYLAHTRLRLSYHAAGAMFGRDRTTARHACRKVEDRREDPRVDSILDCLERAVDLWPRLAEYRGRGA